MRKFFILVVVAIAVTLLLRWSPRHEVPPEEKAKVAPPAQSGRPSVAAPIQLQPPADTTPAVAPKAANPADSPERSHLADELNAPDGSIARDVAVLNEVFSAWRTNFPHDGNPWGDNIEITTSLTGKNPLQLALIPPDHPAIVKGELVDRWGTPFRLHALAHDRMEIRSAGPDKKFGTADDTVLTP